MVKIKIKPLSVNKADLDNSCCACQNKFVSRFVNCFYGGKTTKRNNR